MPTSTLFTMITFYTLVLFVPVALALLYRWPRLWPLLVALHLGALTGLLDLRSDDPQGAVLLLFTFGMFVGFAEPRNAWRWALALGLWIPVFGLIGYGLQLTSTDLADMAVSLFALAPALAGTYAGAFVQRASRRNAAVI